MNWTIIVVTKSLNSLYGEIPRWWFEELGLSIEFLIKNQTRRIFNAKKMQLFCTREIAFVISRPAGLPSQDRFASRTLQSDVVWLEEQADAQLKDLGEYVSSEHLDSSLTQVPTITASSSAHICIIFWGWKLWIERKIKFRNFFIFSN